MRNCVFCDAPLSGKRAKEHVYRNSWLKKLGHSKTFIPMDFVTGLNRIAQRIPVADQLQAGEICSDCNGGWMNDLDKAVEDVVLGLARSEKITERPGLERAISLWLFKTAFAFSATDRPERRHVPKAMMHALKHGVLPSSYITFIHHTLGDDHHIGACLLDAWPPGCENIGRLEQHRRFKFAIQYNNVIFGCAYATWPGATFVLKAGYHTIIQILGASHRVDNESIEIALPESVAFTKLNYILLVLGAE